MDEWVKGWLASENAQRDIIAVKRIYVDINDGDLIDGIMFSQIMFWHGFNLETGKPRMTIQRDGELWLAKRAKDWWDECRITERYSRDCIKRLAKRGLIIVKTWKFNDVPTTHLRINWSEFKHRVQSILQNPQIPFNENRQMDLTKIVKSITESTTEITTKNTEEKEFSPAVISQDQSRQIETVSPSGETAAVPQPEHQEASNSGNTKTPPPESAASPSPRKKNALQEAVGYALDLRPGGHAGRIGQMLTHAENTSGKWALRLEDGAMTPEEICAWGEWLRAKDGYADYKPQKAETIIDSVTLFRADKGYDRWMEKGKSRLGRLMGTLIVEWVPKPGQFLTLDDVTPSEDTTDLAAARAELEADMEHLLDRMTNHAAKNTPKDQAYFEQQKIWIAEQRKAYTS